MSDPAYFRKVHDPKPNDNVESEKLPRFKLVRFADLKIDDEPEYLVPGIIPTEGFGVIWGPPKEGKSFWTFDLFMHVALGWIYRGLQVQQGPVAYCAFEGASGFKKRGEAFRQKHPGADEAEFFLIGGRADLIKEHGQLIADIKRQAGDRPPRVIVLDTLNRSLVGSESKDADMSAYICAADAIREAFPGSVVVVVVHHCGISGDRPRGHTSLTGAADFQLKVWKDDGKVHTEVEWLKEGEEGEVLVSRLEQVIIGADKHGNNITSCVVVPSEANPASASSGPKLTKNQQTMFSILYDAGPGGLTTDQWNDRARSEGIGTKRKADLCDIRGALKAKHLVREFNGRWTVVP